MFKSVNVLRLNHGQKLISELTSYCQRKNISSAIILGIIGSLETVTFGTAKKGGKIGEFSWEEYQGLFGVLSSQGSLSVFEDKMVFHIHMVLTDVKEQGKMMGGHLEEAVVWATTEIYIGELGYQLCRDFDPEIDQSAVRTT